MNTREQVVSVSLLGFAVLMLSIYGQHLSYAQIVIGGGGGGGGGAIGPTGPTGTTGATGAAGTCTTVISTSGPVSDPGGPCVYLYNNSGGAITFNAPSATTTFQLRVYRQTTGNTGVITVQMAASNKVDLLGTNGSSAGTLLSPGTSADEASIRSDTTNHWYGVAPGWTNP